MKIIITFLMHLILSISFLNSQVIYEIYGAGGNTGATWRHDVVILQGTPNASLVGNSLQYASAAGTTWSKLDLSGSFNSNGFYYIQLGSGGSNGSTVYPFTFSQTGNINISATTGKLALVSNTTLITAGTSCPSNNILDFVGFGTANCFEGSAAAPAPSATTSIRRTQDTNQNSDDFVVISPALPVEFSKFNISINNSSALITFSTASETNNDFFTIERSGDGRRFESIGEIKGAGDSREERHYSFTDVKPFSGVNYYRIKQTDFDGKYSYSEIKSVRFSSALPFDITPRQTEGSLLVATEIENYSVQVLGSDGRLLLSLANLSASQHIDLNAFKPGIYYIRLIHEGVSETKRIVRI